MLKPQRLIQCSVMTECKALKIPQALAAAQDPEHRHQEQKPLRKAHPASHPSVRDRLQETDQVGRGIDRRGFWQRGDPLPPTKPNRRSPGELSCDGLSISPGPPPARRGPMPKDADLKAHMARKLRSKKGARIYAQRKAIVEPVNGQIKEARGLRRFPLRGLE